MTASDKFVIILPNRKMSEQHAITKCDARHEVTQVTCDQFKLG